MKDPFFWDDKRESEKVIMEIPSEEAIEFSEKMDEITGMLFDHSR